MDDEARLRVLTWVSARYDLAPAVQAQTPASEDRLTETPEIPTEPSAAASQFATLGELFGAAHPRTNGERALIAGYWLQVKGGAEDLSATDRSRMSPQPRADSDSKGGQMSTYSRAMKRKHGL